MPAFVFKFESVLRVRRHRRDQCRRMLADLLADDDKLAAERAHLEQTRTEQLDELRELGRRGEVDIDRSASRQYYIGRLLGEMRLVDRKRETLAGQLKLCRQALVKADQEVKMLEKLREKHEHEFRAAHERHSARELEDTWLASRLTGASR